MDTTMSSSDYLQDMIDMENNSDVNFGISNVAEFYKDCNILITGSSGFVGKLLIEKLLRSCPGVAKLYLLMRAKKGKTPEQRLKEQFEDPLYEKLSREQPDFLERVVMVEGDAGEENLGLSSAHREFLVRNTHVVFHGAATVRFDESLRKVVTINVRGTKSMLLLAEEMKNLKAFVHISTAYSHSPLTNIDEKFYKPAMAPDKAIDLVGMLDDDTLAKIAPSLIGKWPNTYAFSKAVGEDAVRRYGRRLPVCVVRPSIMVSTHREPVAGWTDNMYGATGVTAGAYICILRVLHADGNKVAEIIPADYVINNILVAAWDIGTTWNKRVEEGKSEISREVDPVIYNSVSSCQNPITWADFLYFNWLHGVEVPTLMALWYHIFFFTNKKWIFNFSKFFLHLVPAAIIDTLAWITGREPLLLKAYRKIHKFANVIAYFSTKQWRFNNDNVLKLWEKMGPLDRHLFNFNVDSIEWWDYSRTHIRGVRVYLLNDPMETVEKSQVKYKLFKRIHFILITMFFILMIWASMRFFLAYTS